MKEKKMKGKRGGVGDSIWLIFKTRAIGSILNVDNVVAVFICKNKEEKL